MRRIIILTLMLIQLGTLTACSTMNSKFDCPNQAGVRCKSLDQINAMVNNGQLSGRATEESTNINNDLQFQAFPQLASYQTGSPIRYGETVQRIWIAPYEDTEGNYHQDSVMYVVMKNGHWIGNPVKTIRSS